MGAIADALLPVREITESFVGSTLRRASRAIRGWAKRAWKKHPLWCSAFLLWVLYVVCFCFWFVSGPYTYRGSIHNVVNDVTQMNPIEVERVVYPRTVQEVQYAITHHEGPIAIGGGHYSMGGQTACPGCLSLDMRRMNHILNLDVEHKTLRVEAGSTWRHIQETVDPHDLSVTIMQSYSNFTVGGALSVNAHGRYIGEGPVVRSVLAIKLVLADGSVVDASPTEHEDLFYGAIGGYGGIGVIVEATLRLSPNVRLERITRSMDISEYRNFFAHNLRDSRSAVFHNGDIYPPDYRHVQSVTFAATTRALTEPDRLVRRTPNNWFDHLMLYWVTELPLGKRFRDSIYDPIRYWSHPVVMRNHEASYDVMELEPPSREESTYVLQEYFVPVARFDDFANSIRAILQRHDVNALNISIRHARPDPGTLMAWAREECFSFVLYYKQEVGAEARDEVGVWTRELVDAVLAVGGTYYLPYQPHPTLAQFRRAYPRFDEYVSLKHRVDPDYRFRNTLWDTYLPPEQDPEFLARARLHDGSEELRAEGQTFLTLPEWYIVFSAEEYANTLRDGRPSDFPYFAENNQFWNLYRTVYHRTRHVYPPNPEYHVMNCVIGVSFSAENIVKGLYENTIGRLTEMVAGGQGMPNTPEDRYAARVASDYNEFIRTYPWYEFAYGQKFKGLWSLPMSGTASYLRSVERRVFLSIEYGFKAAYAGLIGAASHSAYGVEGQTTPVWVQQPQGALPEGARSLQRFPDSNEVVDMPRYEGFLRATREAIAHGTRFHEISGNRFISLTVVAPRSFSFSPQDGEVTARWDVLTNASEERALIAMPVANLHTVLPSLERRGVRLDHIFDF